MIRNSPSQLVNDYEFVQSIRYKVTKFSHLRLYESMEEGDNRHKSELLFKILKRDGFNVRKLKVVFDWKDLPIPHEVIRHLNRSGTLWVHTILEVKIGGRWVKLDCTWNKELERIGFPVTKNWDANSDTFQVTKGVIEFHAAKNLKNIKRPLKEESKSFALNLNDWLKRSYL